MEHARFSPSQLHRIIGCPGSLERSEQVPPPPYSAYAEEGTLLHEHAKNAVYHAYEAPEAEPLDNFFRKTDMTAEHKVLIKEVLEKLEEKILSPAMGQYKIIQDIRVHMNEDVNGTLDLAVETETAVHIVDFKFGAGVSVDPENNPQLLAYLAGYLEGMEGPKPQELYTWIFQPRLNKYECSRVFHEELEYFHALVDKTVKLAKSNYPPIRPGEKQCRWCPVGAECPERLNKVKEDAALVFSAFADMQEDKRAYFKPDIKALAEVLKMEDRINSAFKAIKEHLYDTAMAGEEVPGYKLVTGRSSRKWNPDIDIDHICAAFPELDTDDILSVELISPAKLEKLLPAKERSKLEQFYTKTEGQPTLVQDTNPKEALDMTGASVFVALAEKE